MSEEHEVTDEKPGEQKAPVKARTVRQGSRSLFAPVVLIGAGVFFLLENVGIIDGLNWDAALSFWPLALIFLGLNVLAVQLRPPLGSLLSGLLGLAAVLAFGYLLLGGSSTLTAGRTVSLEVREERFRVPLEGVESADIVLDLGNAPVEIGSSSSEDALIDGVIFTATGLDEQLDIDNGRARYHLGERSGGFSLNPTKWFSNGGSEPWTVALSPAVPIDLTIDGGNGLTTAELNALLLTGLNIDGGNAALTATLPDGDYNITIDGGNASMTLALPDIGEREVRVDAGNAPITLVLPAGVAARVEYDGRQSGLIVSERFDQIGGGDDLGVYQAGDYDQAADHVLFVIDGGNSPVTITEE